MKQIFDWMRKKPLKAFEVYDGSIGVYPCEVNRLIDEAEAKAKWEAEVCNYTKLHTNSIVSGFVRLHEVPYMIEEVNRWNFCPYCGKPIKISEVE